MTTNKRQVMLLSLLISVVSMFSKTQAQDGQVKEILSKMQRAYQQANYLDFRVAYYYVNQGLPDKPLDSLLGRVQMDRNRCRLVIDNTELLVTDKYTIQVMRDEKTIYLSNARHSNLVDPVGLLDSLLGHMSGVHAEVRHKDGTAILVMNFPPGGQYSKVTMLIEEKTGYLQRATYDVHAASLMSPESVERPGHPGAYKPEGQVDVVFTGYRSGNFGETIFDESRFIRKVDDKYEPSERFKDYHIFLASTNL